MGCYVRQGFNRLYSQELRRVLNSAICKLERIRKNIDYVISCNGDFAEKEFKEIVENVKISNLAINLLILTKNWKYFLKIVDLWNRCPDWFYLSGTGSPG